MDKYTVYKGQFKCQTCNADVFSLRHYPAIKEITWMCSEKHVSKVSLSTKKNKKDYERTI